MTNRKPTIASVLRVLMALLVLGAVPRPGLAQDQGTGEVNITLRSESGERGGSMGVGGVVRAGEWVGILLRLNDSSDKQRDVLVRLTIPDADRDPVQYERVLTTNPGVPQPLWMYVRIPYRYKPGDQIVATAFAAVEREGAAPSGGGERRWGFAPGRVLGMQRFALQPNDMLPKTEGVYGILGQRRMGLGRYGRGGAGDAADSFLRGGHEFTHLLTGLKPEDLPDRWMGLMPFDTIVWPEGSPTALGTERAQAISEWVVRGGHLIIVLPRVGQMWTDEANNPLADIMPKVRAERREGVDLEPYRLLITESTDRKLPQNQILHILHPRPDAGPTEAIRIIDGPATDSTTPECLVARRLVGAGMVTMIGIDVASPALSAGGNDWPSYELFWHRILGRRGEYYRPTPADQNSRNFYESRGELTLDRDVKNEIAKTGLASGGVLIGFVVFVAYWLVAGPLGYAVLSKTGRKRHAWVAFVLAAGAFTGIAWGGARAIRPGKVETSHLTLLDHVYGQDFDRARSWVSLLIPEYGEAAIAIGDPARSSARFTNTIAPWDGDDNAGDGFPDSRSYRIESKRPDLMVIPTRSTVKQFQLDWAGGPPWKMPWLVPTQTGVEPSIEVIEENGKPVRLQGVVSHELPGPLREVHIVVNFGQKDLAKSFAQAGASSMTADAFVVTQTQDWKPGDPLDLSTIDFTKDKLNAFKELLERCGRMDAEMGDTDRGRVGKRLTALSLYSMLQTPSGRPSSNFSGNPTVGAQRRLTHGWDLGEWFTQPCVIIIGQLGDDEPAESPVPLHVSFGGSYRPVPQKGRTVVRWIYPLPAKPPKYSAPTDEQGGETNDPEEGGA